MRMTSEDVNKPGMPKTKSNNCLLAYSNPSPLCKHVLARKGAFNLNHVIFKMNTIRSLINEHARKQYNSGFSRVHGPIYVVVSLINVHPLFNGCTFIPGCSFIRERIVVCLLFNL